MLTFQDCRYRAKLRLAQMAKECGYESALLPEHFETDDAKSA
jgi:alkanesulfonate monooxygenase SsuD/methylene tetrahydromethanopterin reductase-like flavin-dependent oxidoreductase (luciferase family)